MPNWCSCDLTVVGSPKDLEEFKLKAKTNAVKVYNKRQPKPKTDEEMVNQTLDLIDKGVEDDDALCNDAFVPYPGDPEKEEGRTCDWCREHWGSKWGICHSKLIGAGPRSLTYYFDSPWSPPDQILLAMSAQHPKLRFKFDGYERGCCYQVHLLLKAGKVIKHKQDNYTGMRGG